MTDAYDPTSADERAAEQEARERLAKELDKKT